ncbi:hypothetical protein Tco_0771886 [Tanacetum coccineum]|uniref:Uncharacterized protein n=1 Tax=Tanacetum coccineum TaxID=301880 RepID=A0ABQ4ZGN6_9ASTR
MCTYLKNMEGYKLKDLKSKGFDSIQEMFDKAFKRVNTFEEFRTELVEGKEKRAGADHMLKSFNREDLETLYKLVKAKYKSTSPVEDLDLILLGDLKTMFEPHVEDTLWRNQHSLRMQHVHIHMLVENKYPLIPSTLTMMLEKKLQIDYGSEMAYQLLKSIIK